MTWLVITSSARGPINELRTNSRLRSRRMGSARAISALAEPLPDRNDEVRRRPARHHNRATPTCAFAMRMA